MNTRNKRASACFPLMPWRTSLPAPDGTIGQGDRQQVTFVYSGILAGAAVVPSFPGNNAAFIAFRDKRAFVMFRDKRAVVKGD